MKISSIFHKISNAGEDILVNLPQLLGLTIILWGLSLSGASCLSQKFSSRISNQSELETILKEERKKLLIKDSYLIHVNLRDENIGNAGKIKDNKYEINLGGKYRTISVLRHELYHIADNHCDEIRTNQPFLMALKDLFYYEPQAILYQVAGIKL